MNLAPPELVGEQHALRAFSARSWTAMRARNAHVWASDGRRFLDMGGASHGVALTGHAHPKVVAAIQAQVAQVMHVAAAIPTPERAMFLERLHDLLPDTLSHTFLANSGTEAIECALKLATAATGRSGFVAAEGAFHGRTRGALSLTHKAAYREPFGPGLDVAFARWNDVDHLASCVDATTAAIVLEPVQGEGGVRQAEARFLRAARELADDHGALLVFDEVQSGLGRTGTFLASQAAGIEADIVALGKGLAGGLPIGSCSVTAEVAAALPPGGHGSTYGGSPLVCAAGAATLETLVEERLMARAQTLGARLAQGLAAIDHPGITATRSVGMMACADLRVRPGPVLAALEDAGVLALTGGTRGIRFLPPLTIDASQLDSATQAFGAALEQVHPRPT